ncbi:hypothetical protein NSA56_09690 [Oceanobacillus caeni]|uniref:hypothetical protein n=1 Tax=Oceanobacillus caeni TaxID=405946 RepID=UPI002149DF87|nr:hypothetical protein [Oceanobacillus caeni]MCR1834672.1 hypothetical protein [Oceanobacillus caeni]
MSILVVNCNHWIGFHIVNTLLEHDFKIDGMINPSLQDDLLMFFGRNSDFQMVNDEKREYETCIIIGDHPKAQDFKAGNKWLLPINGIQKKEQTDLTTIHTPILFGEWMPMNENGIYHHKKFITFDSEEFKNNALSIHSFTPVLLQLIQTSSQTNELYVHPRQEKEKRSEKNAIYIRESEPKEKYVADLKKHYKRYKKFYYS